MLEPATERNSASQNRAFAGKHEFELSTLGWSDEVYRTSDPIHVEVLNGQNQYIIAIAPDEQIYTVSASET